MRVLSKFLILYVGSHCHRSLLRKLARFHLSTACQDLLHGASSRSLACPVFRNLGIRATVSHPLYWACRQLEAPLLFCQGGIGAPYLSGVVLAAAFDACPILYVWLVQLRACSPRFPPLCWVCRLPAQRPNLSEKALVSVDTRITSSYPSTALRHRCGVLVPTGRAV